tara:strand:- start:1983 stop:2195 length:213 start_codon:yes stop_codon:yes gene_type:complete
MRRLSGDKVINQDSRALEHEQKSAYQSIGPSRDRKEKKVQSHGFRLPLYYTEDKARNQFMHLQRKISTAS